MNGQPIYGYYPDPTGQPQMLRLWDGTQWTQKTIRMSGMSAPRPDPTWSPPHPQTRFTYQEGLQSSVRYMVRSTLSGWAATAIILGAFVLAMIVMVVIYLL